MYLVYFTYENSNVMACEPVLGSLSQPQIAHLPAPMFTPLTEPLLDSLNPARSFDRLLDNRYYFCGNVSTSR